MQPFSGSVIQSLFNKGFPVRREGIYRKLKQIIFKSNRVTLKHIKCKQSQVVRTKVFYALDFKVGWHIGFVLSVCLSENITLLIAFE